MRAPRTGAVKPLLASVVVAVLVSPTLATSHAVTTKPYVSARSVAAGVKAKAMNAGADVTWSSPARRPSYYKLAVTDDATAGSFTARTHGPFTRAHLSDLTNGHTYNLAVLAEPGDLLMGTATFTPTAPSLGRAAAPGIRSITPTTVPGGGAGLEVRFEPQSLTTGTTYDGVAAFSSSWQLVAKRVAAPSAAGPSITVGPLAPNTTYSIGAAVTTAAGQGTIRWLTASTGNARCGSDACLSVTPTASRFKTTANGILDSVPPPSSVDAFTALRPAMFRVNTGYRSWPGSARLLEPTGSPLVENLADTWWFKTYTTKTGGAQPPWECWRCYSRFISAQVSSIESDGTRPVFWEIENEPGHPGGTYPAHLQGNAALDLRQIEVAATAIHKVDPKARILAPTDGYFLLGTTNLDQPFLSLDAVLAHAQKIPGFAGLDWHEIDAAGVTPALAADDVAMAKTIEAIYGRSHLANVVSEYTTPEDAPLAGAEGVWLGSLTRAGVKFASRSCWTNQPGEGTNETTCANTLADGLFDTQGRLTAPGRADQLYANLGGRDGRRARVTTSSRDIAATAAVADDGTVRVLLGRESTCLPLVNPACSSGRGTASSPQTVTITVTMRNPPKVATVVTVPATVGPTTTVSTTAPVTYRHGRATVSFSVADGTAVEVVL